MPALILFLSAFALAALSGMPGTGRGRQPLLLGAAAACGLTFAALVFLGRAPLRVDAPWALPHAALALRFDPAGAWFLVPVLLVSTLLAHYGSAYWNDEAHPDTAPRLRLFFGLTVAAMALLTVAGNLVFFLVAWESMALLGFLLITLEDRHEDVRRAGWIYLGAAHVGTLCLFAAFALLSRPLGGFTLDRLPPGFAASGPGLAVFVLLLLGFGLKAGFVPLHLWLPVAHPAAPSHVSAMLSGLMLKMGILGLVRILALVPDPPLAWGATLAGVGAVSAVLGIAHASGQRDYKRLLAFSSIENIGIVGMGLGLALVGRSLGRPDVFALGLGGALLHVWNHALFKSMLFLAAGSVLHATGTRDMEQLGGLAKRMPFTGAIFLLGGAAICGLPPLNGFVGEWLIYISAFRALGPAGWSWAVLLVVALALAGGLAVAAFTRLVGIVFLGEPRTPAAEGSHESPRAMRTAMGSLGALCALLGVAPVALSPLLDQLVRAFAPDLATESLRRLAGLWQLSLVALLLAALACGAWALVRRTASTRAGTWDCGYVAPTARMQYTGGSFTSILQGAFQWLLHAREHRHRLRGLFPKPVDYRSSLPEPVLERAVMPSARAVGALATLLHALQGGQLSIYLLYMVLTLVALLAWTLA